MRVFLASARPEPASRELEELIVVGARVTVVANALDNLPEFPRAEWVDEERRMLATVGLSTFELDLRGHYQRPDALADALAGGRPCVDHRGQRVCVARRAAAQPA